MSSEGAKRYILAERAVWFALPTWKRDVIIDCRINGIYDDRIIVEFAHEIAKLAECESVKLDETLPEIPTIRKPSEITEEEISRADN